MSPKSQAEPAPDHARTGGWAGVFALSLCVFVLIASEFMPVSLLTPIAADLALTEGQAGQAIAVSGILAVLTSLTIAERTAALDRKHVVLGLTGLMLLSGIVVTFAPGYGTFMFGRALLGVAIGGFWSLSAAVVMRLVPADAVPRALGILNGGNALATIVAAPLGSWLGTSIGWRGAFFTVVPVAAAALLAQSFTLPAMPSQPAQAGVGVFALLRRLPVALGIGAVTLLFMGQFALFTYLRPFLESVTRVDATTLSEMLLLIGIAGLIGTTLVSGLLGRGLHAALAGMPLLLAVVAVGLATLGTRAGVTAILLAGWGLVGTAAPVAWWTWLSRTLPDDAEAGGGLMVATIQLAITLGAASGGAVLDRGGFGATFGYAAALLTLSAIVALGAARAIARAAARAA